MMDWQRVVDTAGTELTTVGLKIAGALALFIVGRWLIRFAVSLMTATLERQRIDPTLQRYSANVVGVALNIVLVVAILGYFGVETTSFAALVAAMGIAIGAAWGGLLANFAAGAFLIVLRPFKVGDYVKAGGCEGTVKDIGLFASTILTGDNVTTVVGNNKIFSDTIQNFTANPYRRVELTAQISASADPQLAITRLKDRLTAVANVCTTPPPDVTILTFNPFGPVLAVRPYCNNDHYWQVYFDANMAIREVLGDAAFPGPAYPVAVGEISKAVTAALPQA